MLNFKFKTHDENGKIIAICATPWIDPEIFFNPLTVQKAIEICDQCPVKRLCFEESIENREPHGVWGGVSEVDRQKILKRLN